MSKANAIRHVCAVLNADSIQLAWYKCRICKCYHVGKPNQSPVEAL